jgi:hypothetical protein
MCKSRYVIFLNFFLSASIAFGGGAPYSTTFGVDLTNVTISLPTIVPYSLPGQEEHGHTINEVFFLGTYTNGKPDIKLHLFCREIDVTTGTEVDADLGSVDGVLVGTGSLYVWPTDPQADPQAMHIDAHYPPRGRRYVTNAKPGTTPPSKRVVVEGAGNSTADGVRITDHG